MKRAMKVIGVVVAGLVLLTLLDLIPLLEPVFVLLFGWILFLIRTLPQVSFEPAALAVGGASLLLLVGAVHVLARWLYGHVRKADVASRKWRLGWTIAIVGIVVLLFASGISIIGMIHETNWLLTSDERMFTGGEAILRNDSRTKLYQIGIAFHNYEDEHHEFPPGGTARPDGQMLHSWETLLLPYMDHSSFAADMTLPWNHPENAPHFKVVLSNFVNPRLDRVRDEEGYGLSHYALNGRVFGLNRGIRVKDVTDGLSNTIMGGEVKDHFRPWGHPENARDPALGINKSPDGFGSPSAGRGANILMMDGSARFLSEDTAPEVLRALSTPAGGEKVELPE